MKASVVDLRYKMKDVLKAIDRNESVEILYHGIPKAIMKPIRKKKQKDVKESVLFGCLKEDSRTVEDIIKETRSPRYDF